MKALREEELLGQAMDQTDDNDERVRRSVVEVILQRKRDELFEAQRISLRRSGARGMDARKALIDAEAALKRAEEVYNSVVGGHARPAAEDERDWRGEAAELYTSAQSFLEEQDSDTAEARCESILKGLGFSDAQIHGPYKNLSGGWKSRSSLASALLKHCDCLMLDEPSNFLDLPSVIWLQQWIQSSEKTVVVVSHDREFIDQVTEELIVLRNSKLSYFDGNLTEYELTQRRKLKHALKQQAAMDKKKEHIESSIAQGLKQAKKSNDDKKLRMVKSRQKKLDDRWGLEANAKGHRFKLNRDLGGYHLTSRAGIDIDTGDSGIHFSFPDPDPLRFPGALVHLDNVSLAYPDAMRPTVSEVTLTIGEGERVALVGANGHGKTTIINLIMRNLAPTTGSVTRHAKANVQFYEQHTIERFARTKADAGQPVMTALRHFLHHIAAGQEITTNLEAQARRYLGGLGLRGRLADAQPLHTLSGGQLVRLGLAELMNPFDPPDLICLDEVTQHLDSDSINALIRGLKQYRGAILLVSHDRHAVKQLIEGAKSPKAVAAGEEEDDDEDDESESTDDEAAASTQPGRVYLVHEGKMSYLPGGMDAYASRVERDAQLHSL